MVGEPPAAPPGSATLSPSSRSPRAVRARELVLPGLLLAFAFAATSPGAPAATSGYGNLIASSRDGTASSAKADFHLVAQPRAFWLLVSDRAGTKLTISWSISCANAARSERGGAAGKATIGRGHWLKRVRADWIKRPAACSGVVRGSAGRSPVQIHVYAG